MGVAEETTDKIISVSFQAFSTTTNILLQALKALAEAISGKNKNKSQNIQKGNKEHEVKVKKGKMSLNELSGKGTTDYLDISNKKEFKQIAKACKKHKIDYAVLKSKGKPTTYTIFFQTKDTNILKKMLDDVIKGMEKEMEKEKPEPQREDSEVEKEKPEPQKEDPDVEKEKPEPRREDPDVEKEKTEPQKEDSEVEKEKPEPRKEKPEKASDDQPGANANEKNRQTMGAEEREKEEPVRKPDTERTMPVQSNEPKSPTTDSVNRDKKKEAQSQAREERNNFSNIDADSVRNMTSAQMWAEAEKESIAAAAQSKRKMEEVLNGKAKPFMPLEKIKKDLEQKVSRERQMPKKEKTLEHNSLEI